MSRTVFVSGVFLCVQCVVAASSASGQTTGEDSPAAAESWEAEFQAAIELDGVEEHPRDPPSLSNAIRKIVPSAGVRFIPDISFIASVGLGWFFGGQGVVQGGHAMDENGFALQGLEMSISGSVDPYFRYDMHFDFAHLHLEEAYVTSLSLPINMQIRVGYMSVPFGRQNPQCLHSWNFVNPPLSHTRFMGEEHFSGLGMELSFLIPLPWAMTVGAQVLDSHGVTGLRSGTFGTVDKTASGELDGLEDFVYTARIDNFFDLGPDWGLSWGLSGAWGQSPWVPDNRADVYGTDLYLKWRPVSSGKDALFVAMTMEYMFRRTQVPGDLVMDHGGYAQVDVQMTRQWMVGARGDVTWLIDGKSPDVEKIPDRQWRAGVSATFLPTHFSKIRLQYDVGQQSDRDIYHAVFLQLEVGVGEHMAHRY